MGRITRRIGNKVIDTTSEYFDLTHEELVHALFERLAAYEDIAATPVELQARLEQLNSNNDRLVKVMCDAEIALTEATIEIKGKNEFMSKLLNGYGLIKDCLNETNDKDKEDNIYSR